MSQGVSRAVPKRKSGQGSTTNSPQSQHRLPARGPVIVSPLGSPPLGGAVTPLMAEVAHTSLKEQAVVAARSAGSLMGNVDRRPLHVTSAKSDGKAPPTPRGKTPRMPKKTPRMSPRSSWVNGPGPFNRKVLTDEEEKRRRLRPEVKEDPTMRRSASGSHMEGLPTDGPAAHRSAVAGYPVVQPPKDGLAPALASQPAGAESVPRCGFLGSVSGSTTPTDSGEGVPFTLLSRLRNNPVLQVQDSRIMRLIGKRSVLKPNGEIQSVRAKPCLGRQTPMTDGQVLNHLVAEALEPEPRAARHPAAVAAEAGPEPAAPEDEGGREGLSDSLKDDARGKVTNLDSPRNHVDSNAVDAEENDAAEAAAPIVWPGAKQDRAVEPVVEEPAVPVARQRLEPAEPAAFTAAPAAALAATAVAATAAVAAPAAEEVPVYVPPKRAGAAPAVAAPDMPLLQNEAGSLVVPQTWRFVPPPPEQAPKPSYDRAVLEAARATTAASNASPAPREDAPATPREDLTPKKLIEDLVQDQVKLDLRDKQLLVEQLVECLIDQVKRYEKELGAEQRANRALKMSLEVEQRKALMYHQRLTELAQQIPMGEAADPTLEPEL